MDEEALIARAKEEREKIFQRYDKGREPGAEIDPWEDPQFEVFHHTDRYGFIHDKRLPRKREPQEAKATEIEMERVKKWLKLLGLSSQPSKRSWNDKAVQAKVRKRVFKGIPEKVRGKVWCKLLNLEEVMKGEQGKYKKMLELARNWSTEARQIDKDVNRQFRDHIFYRERYSDMQRSLFNVLVAYSMYNSEVGYCQGMSGLAGVLLMYMKEEEAFWALSILLADSKFAMHGLFIEGFPKLTRFLAHHDKIITKFIPKLKKHFDQCNLDSILYSLKWFFVMFIERIPFSLCLRVWDIYLLDGEKVVTAMAYNILRMHKRVILKLRDMDQIVQYIQTSLCEDFGNDDDTVIKNLEQCMEELRKAGLELPPPPSEIELPKKEFGVFVEPTAAAQIGRRKQEFTETEKEVTETVKLKREITEQEIANLNRIATASGGSNQQLNTVHIPESEDGGSLLGSSRKSLADTSVTSTADLSVLSGGQSQRSHQAFDFCVEDQNVIPSEDEGDGESSPVSAIGSTSVVERSPSVLQLMTPRAMSPHDVVRIYVPPAPPDELQHSAIGSVTYGVPNNHDRLTHRSDSSKNITKHRVDHLSRSSYNDEDDLDESRTRRNSEVDLYLQQIVSPAGNGGSAPTDPSAMLSYASEKFSDCPSGDFQSTGQLPTAPGPSTPMSPPGTQHYASNGRSTSSSRRGSMSRKSPAPTLDSEFIIECSHVKNRKYVPPEHHSSHNSLVLSVGGGLPPASYGSRNGSESNIHRMTSFEELAKAKLLQHQLSGSGSGCGTIASGSTSSLRKQTTEELYAIRQTTVVASKSTAYSNRMTRSEIYEANERREESSHYDNPRRVQENAPSKQREQAPDHKDTRGHKSDYNIQYRNLSPQGAREGEPTSPLSDGIGEWSSGADYRAFKSSRQNSGNDSSPFDCDLLAGGQGGGPGVPSKRYNRFFNNDEVDQEDEEEEDLAEVNGATPSYRHRRTNEEDNLLVKSSDDSSTSPPPAHTTSRPSQLPQYQRHGSAYGTGSQQRQRPRQRQPPAHGDHLSGITTSPSNETVPLLELSPTATNIVGRLMHSSSTSAVPANPLGRGTSSSPTSSIPVSNVKRKFSTESSHSITPSGTGRRGSNASASMTSPTGLSRIPVGMKSPTSPTGSLQSSFRSDVRSQKTSKLPTSRQLEDARIPGSDRLPQYQYGAVASAGPASLTFSSMPFETAGNRIGSSRSAHQIQSDSNKIRIQINPSQSYTSSSSTGG